MNALETRLAETERALFFALRELHDGVAIHAEYRDQPSCQAMNNRPASTQQEKADLVASWTSRPLENRTQARAWLESMRGAGRSATDGVHEEQLGAHASNGSSIAPDTVLEIGSLLDTQSGIQSSGNGESDGSNPQERPQQSSPKASRPKGKRFRGSATRSSDLYYSHEDTEAANTAVAAPRSSIASVFANANKNIYF